jgi:cysteine sulfinate desulfinase/cysteine desulfurase-like protein
MPSIKAAAEYIESDAAGIARRSQVVALDQHGISLSSGSACKSCSPKPTHVLMAMGKNEYEFACFIYKRKIAIKITEH